MSYREEKWLTAAGKAVPVIDYEDAYTKYKAGGINTKANSEAFEHLIEEDITKGYAGTMMDDWNWESTTSTNVPGTEENLRLLTEGVRKKAGTAGIIEANPQFQDIRKAMPVQAKPLYQEAKPWPDANVKTALEQIDSVDKEFGMGPTSGINSSAEFENYLTYVELLHSVGDQIHVSGSSNSTGTAAWEYSLATSFLTTEQAKQKVGRTPLGGDLYNSLTGKPEPETQNGEPESWWAGNNIGAGSNAPNKGVEVPSLGEATQTFRQAREGLKEGVYTRTFEHGIVYVIAPGTPSRKVTLPTGHKWQNVKELSEAKSKEGGTEVTLEDTPGYSIGGGSVLLAK
jgi:hypothetical protein